MSDQTDSPEERAAREKREADLVGIRISELRENPIQGNFDAKHLKAVHAYIFQDLPHHRPGIPREDTDSWVKHRSLEGQRAVYDVPYVHENVEGRIDGILRAFGGSETLKDQTPDEAASRLAKLYGDLDHAHGFYEGNSRTLREFTRELAEGAGYKLDWVKTGVGTKERNELYVARDVAVLERAYPDLTPERAMQTNDRTEYEASFVLTGLRKAMDDKSLDVIIRGGLTPERGLEQIRAASQAPEIGAVVDTSLRVGGAVLSGAAKALEGITDFFITPPPKEPPTQAEIKQAERTADEKALRQQEKDAAAAQKKTILDVAKRRYPTDEAKAARYAAQLEKMGGSDRSRDDRDKDRGGGREM